MAKIHARIILPQELDAFDALAKAHGGILSQKDWLDVVAPTCTRIGLFQKDGQLIGGFVCQTIKLKIFPVIAPPHLTPHCGLFYKNIGTTKASSLQLAKHVGEAVVKWLDAHSVSTIHLPFPSDFADMQVFNWAQFSVGTKYTYRINLKRGLEEVLQDISSTTKNVIKKSKKDGVTIVPATNGEALQLVLKDALSSKSGGHSVDIDARQLQELLDGENAFAFMADKNGEPIAGGFFVHDARTSYYILGGVVRGESKSGAGSLLIAAAIEHCVSLGLEVFDFEGSMNPGIEHFFRSFGGDLVPYYQIMKAKKLQRRLLRLRGKREF